SASTGPDIVAEPTSFVHPTPIWLWLALAALIAFLINVVLFVYRIPADRRTFGRIALTSAPAVIALSLIVAALALPHTERPSNKLHLAVVEDRSASVVHRGSLVDLPALKSMQRPGDSLSHLRFSGGTHAARTDDSSTALATDSSNIESALQVALGTTPGGQSRRIVLISDGLQTTGDAVRAARRAGTAQVPIDTIAINATLNGEVVVEQLHVPDEVREGETYDVRIIAHANSAVTAQLVLTRNEQVIADETVELKAGKNVFVYEHFADTQGYHVFAAALQAPGDTHPQNNEALAVVAVHQPARILLFESEPNASAHFVAALGAQGINVDTLGKEDVETGLRNLYQYDALILSNFSSLNLTRAQMERIRGYVYDLGGGLAMFGGEQSFGLGGYYKTPVEEALPVTMVAKQRLDVPSTSVVLVIDRSGSMNRFDGEFNRLDLAKEAAQRAASLLGERSELGVLAFDMKSKWVVPIGAMEDRPGILKSIATLRAGGGGTQLLWGLEKAYRAIARRKTAIRHVIILSDGEVYSTRFPELLRNMVRKNITVSAVTIASQVGISQLRDISQLGKGRFYFTGDASKLPRIFTMETQLATKTGLIEESFTPTVNNRRHEIMRGFDWDNVPSLDGYVATTAKGSAETLLSSHRDDPLVAVWRYGLGRAAVFTSEYKTRWGADWLRWKDFSPAGATLVRWLLRSDPRRDVAAKATFVDDSGKVLVDVAGRDGQRLNFLHGELAVVRPNQTREVIPMVQNAAGLYRAQFAARDNGAYLLGVSLKQNEKSLPSTTTQLVRSYSREYRRFGVDQAILNSIADASGGVRRSSLEGVYDSARPTGAEQHSIWPRWLSVALLALLATIATRWLADRYRLWEHHNA
ncbi:MAG: VWA domain-containing protein, partial [Gammaproteobacteria bacterium]|nr:VWA domain-containing protein [Gammaproteobacteria bacterium]